GSINYTSATGQQFSIDTDDQWVSIVKELDRQDYNNEHGYHRQDRKGVRFCSWDAYNEFGNQSSGSAASVEAQAICNETDAEFDAVVQLLRKAVDSLPRAWRELIVQVFVEGQSQADIATSRGISKAAVTKQKLNALNALKTALEKAGVNKEMIHGLLLDQAHGLAQKEVSK
ncbi:MAG: RNA polymerase sigma factor, partial [Propionibacteriaceae bacterium]